MLQVDRKPGPATYPPPPIQVYRELRRIDQHLIASHALETEATRGLSGAVEHCAPVSSTDGASTARAVKELVRPYQVLQPLQATVVHAKPLRKPVSVAIAAVKAAPALQDQRPLRSKEDVAVEIERIKLFLGLGH